MTGRAAAPRMLGRWWVQALLVFLASRAVSTAILLTQDPDVYSGALAGSWDAEWYAFIAWAGYPVELPRYDDGYVMENQWAFMPVYPYLVVAVSFVTTLPWQHAAVLVSILAAAGFALVTHRLFAEWLPTPRATAALAVVLTLPTTAVLQVAYAESLQLLLLSTALLLVVRRRYLAAIPVVVVMSFTRPTGLAFALFMLIHFGVRLWSAGRGRARLPRRETAGIVALGLTSAVAGIAWLLIAWAVTGEADAYPATELAWRRSYLGPVELVPFTPWFQGAVWWAELVGAPAWLGVVVLLLGLALAAWAIASPWMSRLGGEARQWTIAWIVYLLAVFFPQSSTWRLLMPVYPAFAQVAATRTLWPSLVAIALGVVGQWFWVDVMWVRRDGDWTPP